MTKLTHITHTHTHTNKQTNKQTQTPQSNLCMISLANVKIVSFFFIKFTQYRNKIQKNKKQKQKQRGFHGDVSTIGTKRRKTKKLSKKT